ncbi:MAG TPA: PAS domain S-box protein [Polyangia bacterium]|nr:PAS domain S-box protein [Polyangia bacterium]
MSRARIVRYPAVAGAISLSIAVVVLCGWCFNLRRLTCISTGWPAMKVSTAWLCALSGLALLVVRTDLPRWARAVRLTCATIVGVLALVALLVSSGDISLDDSILKQEMGAPSGLTAVAFLLIAASTFSIDYLTKRGRSPAQVFALGAAFIGSLSLLGYAFGLPALRSPTDHLPPAGTAFETSAALLALASGLLLARPQVGLVSALTSEHAGGVAARRLLLGLLAFIPLALLVTIGRRLGWYGDAVVAALLVLLGVTEGLWLILMIAFHLNARDLQQKRIAALLQASEQRVRQLISQAPDGIFIMDLDGRLAEANEAGCRLLGLSSDEIIGRTVYDFVPEADAGRLREEKERLLDRQPRVSEWSLLRADGTYFPVEVSTGILPDGRWQTFVRDITDRKRWVARLRAEHDQDRRLLSESQRISSAATIISEAVAEIPRPDISTVLHTIALEAQVLTGARYVAVGLGTNPEQPFDPWVVLGMPPELAERIGRHPRPIGTLGEVAARGRTLRVANVRQEPAFHGFPPHHPQMTSLLGVPIQHRGRAVGNLYLADKVNAPEFTAEDLRLVEMLAGRAAVAIETATLYVGESAHRSWLGNVIDEMPDGVIVFDGDGKTVLINRALRAFARDDVGTREPTGDPSILDFRLPSGETVEFPDLPPALALARGESSVCRELALRARDGRLVPILMSAAPIHDGSGAITGATTIIQDITALRETERLREEWTSVIAHDLRQPVTTMSLSAASLARWCQGGGEKEQKAIVRIQSGLERLSRMIDDLLDVSLIDAKRLSIRPEDVYLRPFIESVVEALGDAGLGNRIRVVGEPGLRARLDTQRIQQVLTNLLTNALKYGDPKGEILIQIHDRVVSLEVAVSNRGPGIAADDMQALFSRFGRSPGARATGTPGIGLGLYIAKGLVEAHGGRIWVESTPGQSTTFHFLVPRAPASADHATPHSSPAAPS